MRISLSCNDCGVCCSEMACPPFIGFEIFELPEKLRREVLDRLANDPALETRKIPCYWLDEKTRRCKQYEHRPMVCRDFEVGCDSCRSYRDYHNIT